MTTHAPVATRAAADQRVPRSFQILLACYIIITGDLPTIVQAIAFGLEGGVQAEFAAAVLSSIALTLLLLAPIVMLSRHPLGILHPLLLAAVLWPLLIRMPSVIEQLGGWGPVLLGLPVEAPYFDGLGFQTASQVWTAMAKYNALEILGLCSTYAGFGLWRSGANAARIPYSPVNPFGARLVLLLLIVASTLAVAAFIYYRGGLSEHLFDLGRGRFRALSGMGGAVVIADLGAVSMFLWVAIRPHDARSVLFITSLAVVVAAQFISNGSRASALFSLMVVGLIWALRTQRVPWRIGLSLIPLLFIFLGLMNVVRTSSWTGRTAAEAISDTGAFDAIEKIENEIKFRRARSAQVPIVERGFAIADGPLLGKSYLAAVVAPIPRSIWPDKPRGPGSMFAQMFLGEAREGMAIPVSPAAEAYWNFGVPGVFLLFALYGVLLRLAYQFYWRRYPDPFAIAFYALFVTGFHFSTDLMVQFQQQLVLLIFAYLCVRFFVPRVRTAEWPVPLRSAPGGRPELAQG